MFSAITDSLTRGIEGMTQTVSETFFEPSLRLGVTGLSRSGKTVFITALIANMTARGRMPQLQAAQAGRILTAYLKPQPNDTIPRFDYETHLAAIRGSEPHWPESTRAISELRLSMKIRPQGLFGSLSGPQTMHLDIVDYPGEWLMDLALLEKSYEEWSKLILDRMAKRSIAKDYLELVAQLDPNIPWDEPGLKLLTEQYTAYLQAARKHGFSDLTPGRFLLPGELEGSPVLTFAPLPPGLPSGRRSVTREMSRRYEAYKSRVIKPFLRDHFSKVDRQIVLMDVLGAIHHGPQAMEDLRQTMADLLIAFRPGKNSFLSKALMGKRIEKILFAATKADHLHHRQHARLSAITEALVQEAVGRARFAGAQVDAVAMASLRATVEETRQHQGRKLDCVRGTLKSSGKQAAFYPGDLPADPSILLTAAQEGAEKWLNADYSIMQFLPAKMELGYDEGLPHIRVDRAMQFLIGDRL